MPIKRIERPVTAQQFEQEKQEGMQQIVLIALAKAGLFDVAAFYGGTCLHLIHGLDRFSEDLDFSLLQKDENFNLEKYFPAIINEFKMRGRDVEITKKDKTSFTKVQSAFLKDNTATYDIKFQTEKTPKIKIEVDYLPPLEFETEVSILKGSEPAAVRTFTLPSLFAGKMHALIYRQWKNRVKGRDWYDFEWYVNNGIELDLKHFARRAKEFDGIDITEKSFKQSLVEKILSTDIESAKTDVLPFIQDKRILDNWSKEYFLNLASKVKFKKNGKLYRETRSPGHFG